MWNSELGIAHFIISFIYESNSYFITHLNLTAKLNIRFGNLLFSAIESALPKTLPTISRQSSQFEKRKKKSECGFDISCIQNKNILWIHSSLYTDTQKTNTHTRPREPQYQDSMLTC